MKRCCCSLLLRSYYNAHLLRRNSMNLNNCHNHMIRGAQNGIWVKIIPFVIACILLMTSCAPLADNSSTTPEEPLLTAPESGRIDEPPLKLSNKEPLSEEAAKAFAKKLDTPFESYDLLRPEGAVDLKKLKPSVVLRVVDGDTLIIMWEEQPTRLRLIGIYAPESYSHHDESIRTHEGESVSRVVTHWLEDKKIYLQFDVDPYDPYERLLAYVWLDAHTMVNEVLVREGLVWQHRYPPNTHFDDYFKSLQKMAKSEARGIWSIDP